MARELDVVRRVGDVGSRDDRLYFGGTRECALERNVRLIRQERCSNWGRGKKIPRKALGSRLRGRQKEANLADRTKHSSIKGTRPYQRIIVGANGQINNVRRCCGSLVQELEVGEVRTFFLGRMIHFLLGLSHT